ncbi:4-hydroxy-tetrahydrodipicolinate synthase [Candidatus Bathyarchaeota archaeon]|nr:4-hydroxy-tetrahydrodipicolinate synthase [Candidatus Bathyarchaeota archaeon]
MTFKPEGVMPALVTPFTDNGDRVDESRLRELVDYVIGHGVSALVPCGTTGEFQNLTLNERKRVLEVVVDHTNGRVPVIAGTGSSGTKLTIEATQHAKDVGAAAALVVTPYYHKPADRGIYEHYRSLAEAVDLPIILYNIPQATGVNLSWQMVEDLVEIPNVVGLKDSSGELRYMLSVLEKTGSRLSVLCGHDEVVLPALAAGASGMILASANFMPDLWVELYQAVKRGDLKTAREMQVKVQKISRIIVRSGPVGSKAALRMLGIDPGPVRLPLSMGGELTYEDMEELRIDLEKIGKIKPRAPRAEIPRKVSAEERLSLIGLAEESIRSLRLETGEALAGSGPEVAHVELMIGAKDGPLGEAFAKAKATPTAGHEPLVAILEPNLAVKPTTMIIPTVTIKSMRQASMIYGPAQAAVAKAVIDSVKDGTLPKDVVDDLIIIANVFVHPSAVDRKRVYINNYKAVRHAVRKAVEGRPTVEELLENSERAKHPFRYSP